jgi:hypothetical protein
MARSKAEGRAKNPRGQTHLRAVQVMLNSRLAAEESAVESLDYVRSLTKADGSQYADRELVAEAFKALHEKLQRGYVIPEHISDDDRIVALTNAILTAVTARFNEFIQSVSVTIPARQQHGVDQFGQQLNADVELAINSAITTSNLNSNSYQYESDEDDE